MPSPSQSPQNTNQSTTPQSRRNSDKGSSRWLQTLLITGSLAATGVGALMINQLETIKVDSVTDEATAFDTALLELQPIPTIMVPPTAVTTTVEVAAALPTSTPTAAAQSNLPVQVVPTDTVTPMDTVAPTETPTPTITPQPTATRVVQQQSTLTFPARRRSRSSR